MKDFQYDDPANWKCGMFYSNAKESKLIVRKLQPMLVLTFDFAHLISYVVLIVVLTSAILATVL